MGKNNFIEREDFIRYYQRNGWMDLSELHIQAIHIEGGGEYPTLSILYTNTLH